MTPSSTSGGGRRTGRVLSSGSSAMASGSSSVRTAFHTVSSSSTSAYGSSAVSLYCVCCSVGKTASRGSSGRPMIRRGLRTARGRRASRYNAVHAGECASPMSRVDAHATTASSTTSGRRRRRRLSAALLRHAGASTSQIGDSAGRFEELPRRQRTALSVRAWPARPGITMCRRARVSQTLEPFLAKSGASCVRGSSLRLSERRKCCV